MHSRPLQKQSGCMVLMDRVSKKKVMGLPGAQNMIALTAGRARQRWQLHIRDKEKIDGPSEKKCRLPFRLAIISSLRINSGNWWQSSWNDVPSWFVLHFEVPLHTTAVLSRKRRCLSYMSKHWTQQSGKNPKAGAFITASFEYFFDLRSDSYVYFWAKEP